MQSIDLSIIDSHKDPKLCYIIVDECVVPVAKAKLKNVCYVLKLISDTCYINIDLKDCEKEKTHR